MVDFGTAVRRYYGQYTVADGRATRAEFWWVQLFKIIVVGVLATLVYMADGGPELSQAIGEAFRGEDEALLNFQGLSASGNFAILFGFVFALGSLLPDIMLNIRRFHDLGQTGWLVLGFFLAGMIPVVGTVSGLANLLWFTQPGTRGPNEYGPDPFGA
jgi:uncharacterized membrane protein YhaH (DUF805 family)